MPTKKRAAPAPKKSAELRKTPSSFIVRDLSPSGAAGVKFAMERHNVGSASAAISEVLNHYKEGVESHESLQAKYTAVMDDLDDIRSHRDKADASAKAADHTLKKLFDAAKVGQSDRYRRRLGGF